MVKIHPHNGYIGFKICRHKKEKPMKVCLH